MSNGLRIRVAAESDAPAMAAIYRPVVERYRRCGAGRGLYLSLFGVLAAQGYCNACAGITLPNAASVSLHGAVGFKPVKGSPFDIPATAEPRP
jgi:L-amino acid N-acyltransferase YncA